MNTALEMWNKPLGELHGDEDQHDVTADELKAEARERYEQMLEKELPEDMDGIVDELYVMDCNRDLLWALLKAKHPYEPEVIKQLGKLQCALRDRAREICE